METLTAWFDTLWQNGAVSTALVCVAVALGALLLIRSIHSLMGRMAARGRFDVSSLNLMRRGADAIVVLLAVIILFMQIESLQKVAVSLLASTGVIAVVLGFAAQEAMSNVVGGVFITVFRPFSIGDRIRIRDKDILGIVEDITLRHTVIRTFENNRIIVPNATMNNTIIENARYQEEKVCQFFDIGIGYDADIDRAMAVIADAARSHPLHIDNRTDRERDEGVPEIVVRMVGFGASSLNLRALIWARNAAEGYTMVCDLNKTVAECFRSEGIEIPYAYRTVVIKK